MIEMRLRIGLALLLVILISGSVQAIMPDRKYRFYPEKLGLIYRDLEVKTPDGLKIKTWFYPAQDSLSAKELEQAWSSGQKRGYKTLDSKKRPTVIICNGDAGNMSWQQYYMAMNYTANGYNVVTFDWRGFGESDDWKMNTDYLVYTELLIDYNSVIDVVIKQPEVDARRLAVIGWSTGAYLSMAAASKREEVKCFIGQALMTSFEEVLPIIRNIPKNIGRNLIVPADYPLELNPINIAPEFHKATLLIVGENDERTPVWMSEKIQKAIPDKCETWIVPGATHGGPDGPTKDFKLYNRKIVEFLKRNI